MSIIYLYVKTHNITGLKYFGKTTRPDPSEYCGSGKLWKRHLAKYGNDVTTEIIGRYESQEECTRYALEFSNKHNITESVEWANLKDENGMDGSPPGVKFSEEHKEKIRQSRLGKCYNDFDEITCKKMSEASKIKAAKQLVSGTHPFAGEAGSKLAKERNKKLSKEGKHNFQTKGIVSAVDKNGKCCRIPREIFLNQLGPRSDWEYVGLRSKEAIQRRNK